MIVSSPDAATGTLRLKLGSAAIARASFRLAAAKPKAIKVRLSRAGRKALSRRHRLTVIAIVTARNGHGQLRTTSTRLRLAD